MSDTDLSATWNSVKSQFGATTNRAGRLGTRLEDRPAGKLRAAQHKPVASILEGILWTTY
jgi:hypothetical protein